MAGYRTVDELMDILEEECLEFDAVVSIVGGNNKYDYQVITVPKKNVHIKKDGAYIDMLGLDQPFFFPNSEVPCDAGMSEIDGATVDQILDERRMELVCEWGERYNDLIRTAVVPHQPDWKDKQ